MSKIITIYSIVQGNGAKFTATNLANAYKKMDSDTKVVLIDFDFRFPFLASGIAPQDEIHGIDNLLEKIDGQFLDEALFEENMVKLKNGVHLLKGTKLQNRHSFIDKNHIEKVLEFSKEIYDVVIVVANSDFDNSGSIYSAVASDDVILVGQPNYSTYLNFNNVTRKLSHYTKNDCKKWFLYNKYFESKHIDLNQLIIDNFLFVLGVVPYMPESVDNLDLKESVLKGFLGGGRPNKNESSLYEEIIRKINE